MAYTLRAALDALPPGARVDVAELVPAVAEWCRGPLAPLTDAATSDPRVTVIVGDVSRVIRDAAPGTYDAILLDLYEGPHAASQRGDDPFYGPGALARSRAALAPGGVLAVWSEDPDDAFLRRFRAAGYTVNVDRSGSSRVHVVYLGTR
jgi:spermidine synthase